MNLIKTIIFLLALSFTTNSYAQKIDSLLTILKTSENSIEKYEVNFELTRSYGNQRNWKSANFHLSNTLDIAQSLKDDEKIANTYFLAGRVNSYRGLHKTADSLYMKALEYTNDQALKVNLYSGRFGSSVRLGNIERGKTYLDEMRNLIDDTTSTSMGEYYFHLSNYYGEQHKSLNQLQYLQKAKKIFQTNNQNLQTINQNITSVFENLKAYEKVLELQKELRKSAQELNSPISELFSLFSIMSAELSLKEYEATKRSCFEAINLKNNQNVSVAFGFVYYILGCTHLQTEQLDSAEYYFNKGIEISEKQNEAKELGDNHAGMAELMYMKGNLKNAKFHAERSKDLVNYVNIDNNSILSKIYAKEGNYKNAYETILINWSDWEANESKRSDYQIISTLLSDKIEQEKIQEKILFQQKVDKEKQYLIGGILATALLLLGIIVFIQVRNNRRLKVLNHQLTQQNNTLSQFSYIASHDIKEPMRSIGNYVGLIRRKLSDKDKESFALYFDHIKSGLKQIYTLIEDVMQYTQTNQEVNVKFEAIDLHTIIKNIEISLEPFIQEKGAKIIYKNLPTIESNSSMLFMILKNLIQNGIKFNQSELPKVQIQYNKTSTHHQISVSDNGIGINKAYHSRVFEMFKRLHNKSTYLGSGIGLSIVTLSIEKLGGTIGLESEEGKGSKFIIYLPIK